MEPSKGQWGALGGDRESKQGGGGIVGAMGALPGVGRARKGKGALFGKKKVQNLQTGLNQQGADPALKVDGDYGPKTKKAVDKFNNQQQNIY